MTNDPMEPSPASMPSPHEALVRLDVIVVGAGLGGLATAVSIAQSGSQVTVFEAAKELSEVNISPTTVLRMPVDLMLFLSP